MEIKVNDLKEKLERIKELTRDVVGKKEENVKQKIVVPLLECFGHHRNQLDFEYATSGKQIDIFIKDLPSDSNVIIDTKNYDEALSNHLGQIGLYALQEGAILALLINGEEIRIYDPSFRGFRFEDSLLYLIKRTELTNDLTIGILCNLLSRKNLKSRKVKDYIVKRENEIIDAHHKIREIKDKFEMKKMELSDEHEELTKKLNEIQGNIRSITEQISKIDYEKNDEINEVNKSIGLLSTASIVNPPPDNKNKIPKNEFVYADKIEVLLPSHDPKERGYIPFPKKHRSFFPGYKVPFILETDIGEFKTKVTAGSKGTKIGDPDAGSYITGKLQLWYNKHRELKEGSKLIIEVIEVKKRYRLSISK